MKYTKPLKAAVLIAHRPNHPGEVGGLVGTWERISEVAASSKDIDLTIFFLGDRRKTVDISDNVRRVLFRPALGTERFPFLKGIPTHTDLAPFHPAVLKRLPAFDILHTTDTFYCYAKTAHRVSKRYGIPLTTSVQTDMIAWARIHTPAVIRRIIPLPSVAQTIMDRFQILDRQERSMEKRFGRYCRACRGVFYSHPRDLERIRRLSPSTKTFFLRRGIDRTVFNPNRRDRDALIKRFDIPEGKTVALFVGRLDPVKGIMIAAESVRNALKHGKNAHLLVVGNGSQKEEVKALLQDNVTLTGNIPQSDLGWVYASSDFLLFPSEAEVWPNVVMEAGACGLPVVACVEGAGHVMEGKGVDGFLLPNRDTALWAKTTKELLDDPETLKAMAERTSGDACRNAPSWDEVLNNELLPVWADLSR